MNSKTVTISVILSVLVLAGFGGGLYVLITSEPGTSETSPSELPAAPISPESSSATLVGAGEKPALDRDSSGPGTGADGSPSADGRGAVTDGATEADGSADALATNPAESTPVSADPGSLFVQVEDEDREPVTAIRVELTSNRGTISRDTDQDGIAAFEEIPAGKYAVFLQDLAEGEGDSIRLRSSRQVSIAPGGIAEVNFRLLPFDSALAGRVFDGDGLPVAGIGLGISPLAGEQGVTPLARTDRVASVQTDEEGVFEFTELSKGEYVLATEATETYPTTRRNVVVPGAGVDVVLYPEERVRFAGLVTDTTGTPLEGAIIATSTPPERTTSDANGEFEMEIRWGRNPDTRVIVSVHKEGYLGNEEVFRSNRLQRREGGGWEVEAVFELESKDRLATLVGTVTDFRGNAVGGERIFLHSPSVNARYHANSTPTGSFVVRDVRVAEDYRLWVYPRQTYQDQTIDPLVVEMGENHVDVVLDLIETGTLEGRILDTEKRPVSRLTIHVRSAQSSTNTVATTTDELGRFRVENVPAGDLTIETRAFPRLSVRGIKLEPGSDAKVEVHIGRGKHRVAGVVRDEAGEPVTGARVTVTWMSSSQGGLLRSSLFHQAFTDANGEFEVSGFAAGSCLVNAVAPGFQPGRQAFQITDDGVPPLELSLVPPAR